MTSRNIVEFGLSKVHWAEKLTDAPTYGAYTAEPGAVQAGWEYTGGRNVFRADNKNYSITYANNGGTLTIELAKLSDEFKLMTGLFRRDANGAIVTLAKPTPKHFAMAFDIDGDAKARENVFFDCVASLPGGNAQTTEENDTTPQTQSIEITYSPIVINSVEMTDASVELANVGEAIYNAFYDAVYLPTFGAEEGSEFQLTTDGAFAAGKTYYLRSGSEGSYSYSPATVVVGLSIPDDTYYELVAVV